MVVADCEIPVLMQGGKITKKDFQQQKILSKLNSQDDLGFDDLSSRSLFRQTDFYSLKRRQQAGLPYSFTAKHAQEHDTALVGCS